LSSSVGVLKRCVGGGDLNPHALAGTSPSSIFGRSSECHRRAFALVASSANEAQ